MSSDFDKKRQLLDAATPSTAQACENARMDKYLRLYQRLISRSDAWARQSAKPNKKGKFEFHKHELPLDNDILQRSIISNAITVGPYVINPTDSTVRNPLIDVDNHKGDTNVAAIVKKIYDCLKAKGMHPYIEGSAGKIEDGAHIGLITQPTPAKYARAFLLSCLKEVGEDKLEVFPKQLEITEKDFGNLVKLPFQFNNRTKIRSEIIDPETMLPFTREDALNFMLNLPDSVIPVSEVKDEPVVDDEPEPQQDSTEIETCLKKLRPCFKNIYINKIPLHGIGDDGHNFRHAAAVELIASGADDSTIHDYLTAQSDYDHDTTQKQIDQIRSKGYKPLKCDTILGKCSAVVKDMCGSCLRLSDEKLKENIRKKASGKNSEKYIPRYKVDSLGQICKVEFKKNEDDEWVEKVKPISNFHFDYKSDTTLISGEVETVTDVVIGNHRYKFIVDTKTSSDNRLFEMALKRACPAAKFEIISDMRIAFTVLKDESNIKKIKKVKPGWNGSRYIMPSVIIDKDGIHENKVFEVDYTPTCKARFVDMKQISDDEFNRCGKHIVKDLMTLHDLNFMRIALSDAYGAPFVNCLEEQNCDEIRYTTIARGTPGFGKSFAYRLMQSHYGYFPEDNGYITWGGTVYGITQEASYFGNGVLVLVDDISKDILNDKKKKDQFHDLIHNYTTHTNRPALSSSGQLRPRDGIDGYLAFTAENNVTEGQSDKGRARYNDLPENEKDLVKGAECKMMKQFYPGFTARYIAWVIKEDGWQKRYKESYEQCYNGFYEHFNKKIELRAAKMYAISYCNFEMFCKFMVAHGFITADDKDRHMSGFKEHILRTIESTSDSIQQEKHTTLILDTLKELLAGGAVPVAQRHDGYVEYPKPIGVVLDDEKFPDLAFLITTSVIKYLKEYMRTIDKTFMVDSEDVGRALKNEGWIQKFNVDIVDGKEKIRHTYKIRFNRGTPATWCIKRDRVGIPDVGEFQRVSVMDIAKIVPHFLDSNGIKEQPTMKQFNWMINCLIEEFRPGLSEKDKSLMWNELVNLVELVFLGRRWFIPKDETPTPISNPVIEAMSPDTPIPNINELKAIPFDMTKI